MPANTFRTQLLRWYDIHARELPWVNETNPYRIWLCEVIMQQTRVEHGIPYYKRFIKAFPTVKHLANASEVTILKMWEGLGYYSRARNLHATAKTIVQEFNAEFPDTYASVISLKGVGPYMAAAILSYAWNKPYPVVDSNVNRIITRYCGLSYALNTAESKNEIAAELKKVFATKQPAKFNQAMMDFGSLVCRPVNPDCKTCPFHKTCFAFTHNLVKDLPMRQAKKNRKDRYFHFLILQWKQQTVIMQRSEADIWKNLFQFPLIESGKLLSWKSIHKRVVAQFGVHAGQWNPFRIEKMKPQQLTHQNIHAVFFLIHVPEKAHLEIQGAQRISMQQLKKYAFPGIIRIFLSELV